MEPKTKYQRLEVVISDNVAEVILNTQYNSMDSEFFLEIGRVFREMDENPNVFVVILWSSGKVFSSGLNLKIAPQMLMGTEMDPSSSPAMQNLFFYKGVTVWQQCITQIEECKKPVICALHSLVLGGAVDVATACDIRLCTKDAVFSIRETKIGLVADLGTLQRITPLVGKAFAREMAFTGGDYDSARALQHNLVNAVYDTKDELMKSARIMAANIASNSPLVVQGTKKVLQYAETHDTKDALNQVALWNSALMKSEDLGEAITSFMQKKKPQFVNRL
ncbi:dienoyl-CoA isomerase [Acrasis kona]|uniref:Dienoyl-CoA isomerase n=1 Tax=Acrasis kona TaxID=1008807 RepID=A0AAW2ZA33_9EUKA